MAMKLINVGTVANSKNGDLIRNAFIKINENFTELYAVDTSTKYHLGDDVQFIDIDPNSGTVVIQSGFDSSMPVYIKGANCSDGGVGGNVIIEAGGAPLPNSGTTGNIELAAQQTTIDSNNYLWTFGENGITQFPEGDGSLFIQGGEISGPEFIALTTNGRILLSTNAETFVQWEFGKDGTLTTPLLLPTSFSCTLDEAHYTGEGSLTLEGTAWAYNLEVQIEANGNTQLLSDDPVFNSNPGYQVGNEFTFTEADHGIPGYSLSIIITDINDTDPENISTGVGFTEPPAYPSTINSSGALKFTSNDNSLVLGTDGALNLPKGNSIFDRDVDGGLNIRSNTSERNIFIYSYGTDGDGTGAGNLYVTNDTVEIYTNWQAGGPGENRWVFDNGGILNLPESISAGNAIIQTTSNINLQLNSNGKIWSFRTDGYLTGESLELQGYLKGVDGSTGQTGQVLTRQSNGGVAWADTASGSSDRITGGNGILAINGGNVQIMPAPSGNVRIYPGATSAVMSIQGSSNTRLEYVSNWDEYEDPPLPAGRNTLTQIDVSAGGVSIDNSRTTGLGNDYDYTWVFDNNGNLQLPEGGDIVDHTGTTVFKTKLSQFENDLEIDANSLTGTTLAENVTSSSLTSVGTLTSLTSSGVVHITNTENSINADTGSLQVDGGAHITKNLIAEGTIYAGKDAYSEVLTNPLIVASSPANVSGGYSQVAILNNTAEASGDFQVFVDGYDVNVSDTGWVDLGFAGSNFSDARYTITQPGDGYVFASGKEGSTNGGSLVLATDGSGTSNDLVFATGGFTYDKERMRFNHIDNRFYIGNGDYSADLDVSGNTTLGGTLTLASGAGFGIGESLQLKVNDEFTQSLDFRDAFGRGFYTNGDGYTLRSNGTYNWIFGTDGILNLPISGDIKRGGVSVLSGAYTLPTATTTDLGGVKVDGTTIVIDGSGVISSTVVGATILKGTWDASTNTPTLSSSLPAGLSVGWQYLVSVTGTIDIGAGSQTYTAGDIVLYDGVQWVDIPGAAGSVASFNNRTGAVSLTSGDVTTALGFTPIQNSSLSVSTNSPGTQGLSYTNGVFTFTPALNIAGNSATATKLATARNINGVAFDGTGDITVTAAAGTLSGNTLNSGVTGSSLTSVGTLVNLTVTNPIAGSVTGSAGSVAASALTGTTLASGVTSSSLTSVGTLANLTVTNPISGSVTGNAGTVTNGVYTTSSYADPSWITSLAYSKLSGAPTLATVATSGSYTDLANKPTGLITTSDTGTVTNTMLANNSITINGTSVSLGGSTTVTASADAGTLTGTTLASGVVNSSLTSVGTLTSLTTSGSLTRSGAISSAAWTLNGIGLKLPAATYTDTSSSGTVTNNFIHAIGAPTITSTSVTSVNNAATLYIAGDPIAGTNTTLTAAYSLYVGGKSLFVGNVRFNGNIQSGGGATMMGFSNTTATVYSDLSANGQTYHPNRTAFRVYGTGTSDWTTTSPTGGVMTNAQWTQDYQTGTALGGGTGIFTAPYAGLYSVTLQARCKDNASPQAQCLIQKTAVATSTTSTVCMLEWAANSTATHIGTASTVKLAVGDTLKFIISAGTIHFDTNDSYSVTFIG